MDEAKCILAIDPGSSSGAFALATPYGVQAWNMPDTPADIYRFIRSLRDTNPGLQCACENVGTSRPGNSAASAYKFALHRGHLEMALLALEIPHRFVTPQKWMSSLFGDSYPRGSASAEVRARKDFIYARMQQLYPGVGFTKRQADALGILTYARS